MAPIEMAELRKQLANYDHRDLAQAPADVDRRDLLNVMYPVDGPHDHDRTADAAATVAALIRFLNYATNGRGGTPHPGTVDRIVAHLEGAVGGLQQTLHQTADRLDEFAATPGLASDGMAYQHMTPPEIATVAAAQLRGLQGQLGQLHTGLSGVHDKVARLYIQPPEGADVDG